MQSHSEQRGHVSSVSGRESPLAFQSVNELTERKEKSGRLSHFIKVQVVSIRDGEDDYLGEEEFAVEQVGELHQALLHRLPTTLLDIQISPQWRLSVAREENAFGIHAIVKERDSRAHQVTGHVHHLCHQV